MRHALLAFIPAATTILVSPSAPAVDLSPAISFSVHDEPPDGLGDSFNSFSGLIRFQSTREDRAGQEFDVSAFTGGIVTAATLSGKVSVNNAFDNGPRTFDFLLYAGNGLADLTDFEIAAVKVGSGSYHPPSQSSFTYSFDVAAAVQTLLSNGATFIGLKVVATSNPNFPNILEASVSKLALDASTSGWTNVGFGLPGTNGVPVLTGQGSLVVGTLASLSLANAFPNAVTALVIGAQNVMLPLFGGTLVPSPDVVVFLPVGPAGTLVLAGNTPAGIPPGAAAYFQFWVPDPGGVQGFAASNAISVVTP